MKLIESIWKLEKQNKNSIEIANLAGQMYDQIVKSKLMFSLTLKKI